MWGRTVLPFPSVPSHPSPVTGFVLALLTWPWGEAVQGPDADENLKQANRKRQVSCQPEQLAELAHSIVKLLVPEELV